MKSERLPKVNEATRRKTAVWTNEKVCQLIKLYQKHECLWKHWHEAYRSKEKRNRSVQDICTALNISKFEFGKKIHNLRNQFNTEMKKLEQRVAEAGESIDGCSSALRCKWHHFESLMFLRNVIEPRPGTYQPQKKLQLRFDYGTEDDVHVTMIPANINGTATTSFPAEEISQYQQYEEDERNEDVSEEYHNFESDLSTATNQRSTREEILDHKYQPPSGGQEQIEPSHRSALITTIAEATPASSPTTARQTPTTHAGNNNKVISLCNENPPLIELSSNNVTVISSNPAAAAVLTSPASTPSSSGFISTPAHTAGNSTLSEANEKSPLPPLSVVKRDQWDAFGELVACEFRNLNSDVSRKKLKRKIMQAMVEVGAEDDALN